ncbi:MAG: hypothetical protein ACRDT4_05515 [Micromonosporaceae bacterium]
MQNPFSTSLRAALASRGYSLEQLARELRRRGTPVSASALGAWQTGDNHPERASSIAAVANVEAVLGLPPRSLVHLIPPRRARGRTRPTGPGPSHRLLWRSPEAVSRVLAKLEATPDELDLAVRISRSQKTYIDSGGYEREIHDRHLLLGTRRRIERVLTLARYHSLPQPPTVFRTEGCRLGRFRADVAGSICGYELLLDQPLEIGGLTVIEYAMRLPPGQPETRSTVRVHPGARELTLSVNFDPERVPARCEGFHQAAYDLPPRTVRERSGDTFGNAFQFITLDPAPGIYGLRWEWAE